MKTLYRVILSIFLIFGMSNVCTLNSYGMDQITPLEQVLIDIEQELGSDVYYILKENSEKLYSKFNQFLELHKDASPEEFEEICRNYIADNSTSPTILDKEEFDKQSADEIILYRGLTEKIYADELKKGNIYIGKNIDNIRGNGIYTTSNKECADKFAEGGPVVKMFLSAGKDLNMINALDLESYSRFMVLNHYKEFTDLINVKEDVFLAFDEYVDEAMKDCITQDEFDEVNNKLLEDPVYLELFQRVQENKKICFKNNKFALYKNKGLLAKLLGYNVLCCDEFDKTLGLSIDEYLVLDSGILTICK